jgi:hypothetical protein
MTDEHLPRQAAALWVETGIEVDVTEDGCVLIDGTGKKDCSAWDDCFVLNAFQAALMAEALVEAAKLAIGRNPMNEPTKGSA